MRCFVKYDVEGRGLRDQDCVKNVPESAILEVKEWAEKEKAEVFLEIGYSDELAPNERYPDVIALRAFGKLGTDIFAAPYYDSDGGPESKQKRIKLFVLYVEKIFGTIPKGAPMGEILALSIREHLQPHR